MKKFLSKFSFLFAAAACFAVGAVKMPVGQSAEKLLQLSQVAFDERDYGRAVQFAESAKERRLRDVEWSLYVLQTAFNSADVRHAGDDIRDIVPVAKSREDDCLDVLNGKFVKIGWDDVQYSAKKFLERLERFANFPEADFILGKIYVFSGEYPLAKKYLFSAWESADLLDIPQQKTDILYSISELARYENDDELYEKALLLIAAEDEIYSANGGNKELLQGILRALSRDISIDKFFSLYRCAGDRAFRAHIKLNEFYAKKGENSSSLEHSAVGCLAAFTYIQDILQSRNGEYGYEGFSKFLAQAALYSDITEWASENEVWKGFFNFATTLFDCGSTECANSILRGMALYCPEEYWKNVSIKRMIEYF